MFNIKYTNNNNINNIIINREVYLVIDLMLKML